MSTRNKSIHIANASKQSEVKKRICSSVQSGSLMVVIEALQCQWAQLRRSLFEWVLVHTIHVLYKSTSFLFPMVFGGLSMLASC